MNTVNHSTGFTLFQLQFGWSPRILPPLFSSSTRTPVDRLATDLVTRMQSMVSEAQDNSILAKVSKAFRANKSCTLAFPFKIGECVVLSTAHRCRELKARDPNRVAKFMPCFDGPFVIENTDEKHSTVTLDLPGCANVFPVFHTLEVCPFQKMMTIFSLPVPSSPLNQSLSMVNKNSSLTRLLTNTNVDIRPCTMFDGKEKAPKATCSYP